MEKIQLAFLIPILDGFIGLPTSRMVLAIIFCFSLIILAWILRDG